MIALLRTRPALALPYQQRTDEDGARMDPWMVATTARGRRTAATTATMRECEDTMINRFCKMPLWECNDTLVRVAQGQQPAELVIKDAHLVSVDTRELLEHADIAIACGRIAYLGIGGHSADHCIGKTTKVGRA